MNSSEQIFAEKLKALVRFGTFSGRIKDIFDLCYLSEHVNRSGLMKCIHIYILDDPEMRENDMADIIKRVDRVLSDKDFRQAVENSVRDNWLQISPVVVFSKIKEFLSSLPGDAF